MCYLPRSICPSPGKEEGSEGTEQHAGTREEGRAPTGRLNSAASGPVAWDCWFSSCYIPSPYLLLSFLSILFFIRNIQASRRSRSTLMIKRYKWWTFPVAGNLIIGSMHISMQKVGALADGSNGTKEVQCVTMMKVLLYQLAIRWQLYSRPRT